LIDNDPEQRVVLVVADTLGHEFDLTWVHERHPCCAIDELSVRAGKRGVNLSVDVDPQ